MNQSPENTRNGRKHFNKKDFERFDVRLKDALNCFEQLLQKPNFGVGEHTVGAEMELSIIDENFKPYNINKDVLKKINNPQFQFELNQFNIEYNSQPYRPEPDVFSKLTTELLKAITSANQAAKDFSAQIIPIGILPTVQYDHLNAKNMTEELRYKILSERLKEIRQTDFKIRITGEEKLETKYSDVTPEGANNSFQFHLRVNPHQFASFYNAASLVTPLAVAISANSPIFLDKILWDETRIAVFKQAVDYRDLDTSTDWRPPCRVSFGNGWVRKGVFELFAENVAIFPPLVPFLSEENFQQVLQEDKIPELYELRIHQGAVWHWNRPIYDPNSGGHIRIELRTLPTGPTVIDMVANAAYLVGMIFGVQDVIEHRIQSLPFKYAEHNFYRAAKKSLNTDIVWFSPKKNQLVTVPITDIIEWSLPIAKKGLTQLGIDQHEIDRYLSIIEQRLAKKINGAIWQKNWYEHFKTKCGDRQQALQMMTSKYMEQTSTNNPLATWDTV